MTSNSFPFIYQDTKFTELLSQTTNGDWSRAD